MDIEVKRNGDKIIIHDCDEIRIMPVDVFLHNIIVEDNYFGLPKQLKSTWESELGEC